MSLADIIFCPVGDYGVMYGAASADAALETLAARFPNALIVMTMGADGAIARTPAGTVLRQPAILAGEIGRIGGGDAFAAGLSLRVADLRQCRARAQMGRGNVITEIHNPG